jgi:hypothetical protein
MPSPIDPSQIPGKDIDPDTIEAQGRAVATIAGQVRDHGSNVHLKWQAMAGVYSAPEADTVLGLMQPVSSQATTAGDNLDVVSAALIQFAEDVRPIKAELDSLRERASAFGESIDDGVQVREINPAWSSSQVSGSWNAYGAAESSSSSEVPKYRYVTKEWHEVQEQVDRNNELIAAVNAQQVLLWEAERACANKIRALYGASPLRAAQSEDDALGYGIAEIPEGTEMPWGADVERTEGCGEATVNFVVKDFLWEGIAVGGVWGTITGLGTLVLGYNPETGGFFDGDAYGAAWGNLGNLGFAAMANTGILAPIFQADSLAQAMGGDGFLPQEVRDFKAQADEAAINTGKALIAWDKWQDDPGTALGESVFNVGTALIPVGGAAVAGVKTASTAASVISKMAKVADFVDPAAWAMNGAMKLGGAGLGSLDNLISRVTDIQPVDLSVHVGDFSVSNLGDSSVYVADDAASALRALDEGGVDLSQVTARIDDGVPVYEFPGGRVEMPAGSFDGLTGVRPGDGGADAGVTAPAREPELVSSGGTRGETGPSPVDSIVDDAPVRTETGGSGDGEGSSGGRGDDGTATGDSGSAGDGWERGPEHRGDPLDENYGKPLDEHGTLPDQYAAPAADEIPAEVRHLVTDPDAPYGRGENNEPYTRAEWEERYVGPDGYPIYPGNDGAVVGTRVEYTDMAAFQRDYGTTLDRMGGPNGAFLSPEGVPFESRALPGSNLNAGYHVYDLADELPPGVRVEVSEVAPAFGREGGGIQVRFIDADGNPLRVNQLASDDFKLVTEQPPPSAASLVDDVPVRPDDDGAGTSTGDAAAPRGEGHQDGPSSTVDPTTRATTPERVYSMMDGADHTAAFAPEQLGQSRVSNSLLQSQGITRDQFTDLINRPIDSLTSVERGVVNNIRDALTAQITPDTVFQKVMDQPHFEVQPDGSSQLVFGQAERMVLEDGTRVTGSVSVAQDTAHLATPRAFFESLRLDYPGTNFAADDGSAFVVRFQAEVPAGSTTVSGINPQLHSTMGGDGSVDHYQAPFTGNGFLKAPADILPEYRASDVRMRNSAEVWEVLEDGTQRLFAVLRRGEWIPQGN